MKKGNFFLYTGAVIVCIVLLLVIVGFFWTPYSTTEMDGSNKTQPPSISHLLGTDNFGRDIFSRVLEGAGTSCLVAVSVIAIGCGLGIIIGGLCGYYGGLPDLLLTRICDAITAFPSILLALVILSLLDNGMVNIILVLGLLFVPSFAAFYIQHIVIIDCRFKCNSSIRIHSHFPQLRFCSIPFILPNVLSVLRLAA